MIEYISINKKEAMQLIKTYGHYWFYVEFIKKTTGEQRKMFCSTGVKSGLKGGSLPYDPKKKNTVPVYEKGKGRKSINLDGLTRLHIGGQRYKLI